MRITKLKFSNLNSLKGEFEIDFTNNELIEDNIFAIVGDTGAGKSSILDAITLALFAKTARIEKITGNSNEIMNRDSGDCYSQVFFINENCEYSALFSQRKARNNKDGNLLGYTRTLFDITNNKQIATNKDFDKVLVTLINLTFDQFSRSVLLAQGNFNLFLMAKDDDKSKILEQITGTEIYSEISKKIYEHYSLEKKNLELINERFNTQDILSEDEKIQLKQNISDNQKLIDESNKKREINNKIINYYLKKDEIELKRISLSRDIQIRNDQNDLFIIYKNKLDLYNKSKEPYKLSTKLLSEKSNLKSVNDDINKIKQEIFNLTNDIKDKELIISNNEDLINLCLNKKIKLNEIVTKVRPLDTIIINNKRELNSNEIQFKNIKCKIDNLHLEKDSLLLKIDKIKTSIKVSNDYISLNKTHKILSEKYDEFITNNNLLKSNNNNLDVSRDEIINLKDNILKLEGKKETLTAEKVAVEKIINNINKEYPSSKAKLELKAYLDNSHKENIVINRIEDTLTQYNENLLILKRYNEKLGIKRKEFEKNNSILVDNKRLFEMAKLSLERAKELLKLSAFAKQVVDGKKCPLCGSLTHPHPISINEEYLKTEEQEFKQIENNINLLKDKNFSLKSNIETLEDNIQSINTTISLNKDFLTKNLKVESSFLKTFQKMKEHNINEVKDLELKLLELEKKEQILNKQSIEKVRIEGQLDSIISLINDKTKSLSIQKSKIEQYKLDISKLNKFFEPYIEFKNMDNKVLNQYKLKFDKHVNLIENYNVEIKNSSNSLEMINKSLNEYIVENKKMQISIDKLKAKINSDKKTRIDLFDDKDCDVELDKISNKIEELKKLKDSFNATYNTLVTDKAKFEATLNEKIQRAFEFSESIKIDTIELNRLLLQNQFDSIDDLEDAQLSNEDIDKYNNFIIEFENLSKKINVLDESIKEDESLLNKEKPELSRDEANSNKIEIDKEYDLYQQLKGNYQERLENDQKNNFKLSKIKKEMEKQQVIFDQWSKLNSAVGSSDGQKFRKLAQGITLDYLLNNANIKLNQLTDRYSLVRDNSNNLKLNISVIDLYMNGIERSVKNLSGGEKFLVSLSLALGLSELVNSKNPSETLFLDEGFGSLDEETLENALNTLLILCEKEKKLIGIISHVEKVKLAISHQILVERNGNGSSVIKGPGVTV